MKTIFEKIIDREIPADIVYEDDISTGIFNILIQLQLRSYSCSVKLPYPSNDSWFLMNYYRKIIYQNKTTS
jgi:diadenosine tetraphosphate (Ap4A) HIT family hydrolase